MNAKNYYHIIALAENKDWAFFSIYLLEHPDVVSFIDDKGANIALELAGIAGACNLIESVILMGANPNVRTDEGETAVGRCVLMDSTLNPTLENLKALLRLGANPDGITTSGNTPLVLCLELCKLDHAKCLIESGADLNKMTNDVFPMCAADIIKVGGYKFS